MKYKKYLNLISNVAILVCGVVIVLRMYFREYLQEAIIPMLAVGGVALLVVVFVEIIKRFKS